MKTVAEFKISFLAAENSPLTHYQGTCLACDRVFLDASMMDDLLVAFMIHVTECSARKPS